MKVSDRDDVKARFYALSEEERSALFSELSNEMADNKVLKCNIDVITCPHCQSDKIIKHSIYKDTQRYKCKACNRTFIPSVGTLLYHIKKPAKFAQYASIVQKEGFSTIAKMAQRVGISIPTAFEWRHKLLLSLPKQTEAFKTETQIDDLWFLYSQKGRKGLKFPRKRGGSKRKGDNSFQVKVIAASDKQQVAMKVAKIGRISSKDIADAMGSKFQKGIKLVSDAHKSYQAFAKEYKLPHVKFISKSHAADTGENVQYINNLSGRLGDWINRSMRGVSTKYLQLYASYFAYKEKNPIQVKDFLSNTNVWANFMNIEKTYKQFIAAKSERTYRCPTQRTRKAQNWCDSVASYPSF